MDPVPCQMVAGIARTGSTGEYLAAGHVAPPRWPSSPVGSAAPPSRSNPVRSDWIQRSESHRTPSVGLLAKEPLGSLDVEPAVQSGFRRIRFLFWKTYFSFNRFKIKFHLITVLPLPLIAHNLFVLTPNWTVQLALDSSFRDLSVHIVCHHVFEL